MFGATNTVLQESKDFYVSYSFDSRQYGCYTTALVIGNMQMFLIIEGDHREQLKDFVKRGSLRSCLEYFEVNKHLKVKFSDSINF